MLTKTIAATMTVSTVLGLAGTAHAQPQLDIQGESIPFTGTFEEYRVPNLRGSVVRFVVYGGDGGDAVVGPNANCRNNGGQGATVDFITVIGFDAFQLRPAQPIRFIVGGEGEEGRRIETRSAAGGGGGGGSGVAYQDPDLLERNGWRPLVVAGGGGGASSSRSGGRCTQDEQDGGAAEIGTAGANGEAVLGGDVALGGQNGGPGQSSSVTGGGGGVFLGSPFTRGGGGGFGPDDDNPIGGRGGTGTEFDGGFGFGGGGGAISISPGGSGSGGGGGGGYSGGGAGTTQSAGGGGGSFADEDFAVSTPAFERNSPVGPNGRIDYEFRGQIHDAQPLALPLIVDDNGGISEVGTTFLAGPSPIIGAPVTNGDVWYTYTNTSDVCSEVLRLNTQLGTDLVAIVNNGAPQFPSAGTITLTLEPGDTVELRVSTVTNPSTFNITGSVGIVDQDGDGVCDAIDICPGVDDTTLDPADDVDLDGIHDVCDRLCVEDVVPDGVINAADLEQIAIVLAFGTDQDALELDIDNSGEFDYFDWIEYFDGCE